MTWKHPKYYKELAKRRKEFLKQQAACDKRQASSSKQQATSARILETFPHKVLYKPSLKKFYGTRTKGLDQDKSILGMPFMKANLMR